jgi:acyl carrier protein
MSTHLEDVISRVLHVRPEVVNDALSFQSVPEWDSLSHIGLMLALEDTYGVAIGDDDVIELTSVGAIRAYLARAKESQGLDA